MIANLWRTDELYDYLFDFSLLNHMKEDDADIVSQGEVVHIIPTKFDLDTTFDL